MLLLSLIACKKGNQSVDLVFKLSYGDAPLVMLDDYVFPSGELIKFTRFSFYVSDLSVTTDGTSIDMVDVDFINLTESHSSPEASSLGYMYSIEEIPAGRLETMDMILGVNSELNKKVPADYDAQHPLAKPGEYWIAWDSYIFMKIESK